MKKNDYQKLMQDIHTPEGLNERVLSAAGRRTAKQAESKWMAPRRTRPLLRGAVCAACALALVLGTLRISSAETGGSAAGSGTPGTLLPTLSFGLTAYAADTGESYVPNANGGLAFSVGNGMFWSEESGYYTGCLFQVTGENISQVHLSLDRGGFYRWQLLENLTEEQMREIREIQATGEIAPTSIDQAGDGSWSMQKMTRLGSDVAEDYDPAARYGFWTSGVDEAVWQADSHAAAQDSTDLLNGAILTVTVTFTDGSEQTETYRLSTGRLRVSWNEDGTMGSLLPGLAGDDEAYLYGVYAVSEKESRWLQWPVQDSMVIRLSNPFGTQNLRFSEPDPDDPEPDRTPAQVVVHNGIDIPAPQGSVILAAADGIVTEIGFDIERGNYLVLDHGGGLETVYATCRDFTVEEGDTVQAGEMIGAVGATGMSTGPHLCFQVWQDGEAQNPVAYFDSDIRSELLAE